MRSPTNATAPAVRAVIYARVSKDQRDGRSVEEQIGECRATIERQGWTEGMEPLLDNDRSASRHARKTRPAFEQLLGVIRARQVDVVIVWESSRLTRSLGVWVDLRKACDEHSVRMTDVSGVLWEPYAVEAGIRAVMAEGEVEQTRKRVLRAVEANAVKGRPHGRILFGYAYEYDARTGQLERQVPDADRAPIVQEVFRRYAAGESRRTIVTDLRTRSAIGPGSRARENTTQLTRMLSNPAYVGQRVHRGEVVGQGDWEPLVDDALWARVQTRLGETSVWRRPERYTHLLGGIARCGRPEGDGTCGERMATVKTTRGNYRSLACPRLHLGRREDYVDAHVTGIVLERLEAPDALAHIHATAAGDGRAEVDAAVDELAALRARKIDAEAAFVDGEIDRAAWVRVVSALDPKIEAAELRARQWSGLPDVVSAIAGPGVEARWEALEMVQRRSVITALVEVVVLPVGEGMRGKRGFDPASVQVTWRQAI